MTLLLSIWLACAVCAYLLFRWDDKRRSDRWTYGDRAFCIFMSLGCGPIILLINLLMVLPSPKFWDKPAKW